MSVVHNTYNQNSTTYNLCSNLSESKIINCPGIIRTDHYSASGILAGECELAKFIVQRVTQHDAVLPVLEMYALQTTCNAIYASTYQFVSWRPVQSPLKLRHYKLIEEIKLIAKLWLKRNILCSHIISTIRYRI